MANLEEIKLPPSSFRIRIGEPCNPSFRSPQGGVDLVVSAAMMKRLRKAPLKMKLEEDDDAPVAYVFALSTSVVSSGQKYERVGSHNSETGQTAIIDMETVDRSGDVTGEFDRMENGELWVQLFQRTRGNGNEPWGSRGRLPSVRAKISRSIVFVGDVPLVVTSKANVFVHRNRETKEIDALVIDTGSVFGIEPPPSAVASVPPPSASPVSASPSPPPSPPPSST